MGVVFRLRFYLCRFETCGNFKCDAGRLQKRLGVDRRELSLYCIQNLGLKTVNFAVFYALFAKEGRTDEKHPVDEVYV